MQLFYFNPDSISVIFIAVITVVFACSAVYSVEYMRGEEGGSSAATGIFGALRENRRFYLCFGLTYLVLILLSCAGSLLTFYLCYEALTLLSVPLVLHEQTHEAIIAGLKYLFYSLCGAYMVLFGLFSVNRYADSLVFREGGILNPAKCTGHEGLLLLVLFFMIMGFSVKAGMFPMHAWLTAAHPAAPSPASAVLSGVIVKSGVLGIIRVLFYVFGADFFEGTWVQTVFLILSLVTVFMGSMLAFREKVLKRRLAYSTVSQISYILFGIFIMDPTALRGSILHVIAHALIKSSLFLIAGALIHCTGLKMVGDYKGIGKKEPVLMICYTLCSLALVGIPPTGGFLSKWYMATGALSSGVAVFRYLGPAILLVSALLTAGYLFPICMDAFFPGKGAENVNRIGDFGVAGCKGNAEDSTKIDYVGKTLDSNKAEYIEKTLDSNKTDYIEKTLDNDKTDYIEKTSSSGKMASDSDKQAEVSTTKACGRLMLIPIIILAVLTLLLGMFPGGILSYLDKLSLFSQGLIGHGFLHFLCRPGLLCGGAFSEMILTGFDKLSLFAGGVWL